jgi:hypothetical protein
MLIKSEEGSIESGLLPVETGLQPVETDQGTLTNILFVAISRRFIFAVAFLKAALFVIAR